MSEDEMPKIVAENDISIVEEASVAFDPTTQHMDLTKNEKRRTTALMLAIQAYKNLLIPDAAYLKEASDLARRGEGPKIKAGTIDGVVIAAIKFDRFIGGDTAFPAVSESDPEKEGPIVDKQE